jgi:hypothetical protein
MTESYLEGLPSRGSPIPAPARRAQKMAGCCTRVSLAGQTGGGVLHSKTGTPIDYSGWLRCNALRLWYQAILKRDSVKQTVEYGADQERCTL